MLHIFVKSQQFCQFHFPNQKNVRQHEPQHIAGWKENLLVGSPRRIEKLSVSRKNHDMTDLAVQLSVSEYSLYRLVSLFIYSYVWVLVI